MDGKWIIIETTLDDTENGVDKLWSNRGMREPPHNHREDLAFLLFEGKKPENTFPPGLPDTDFAC